MIEQLKTIREALVLGIKAINHLGGAREAMPLHDAMPALDQLEAMVGSQEPVAWCPALTYPGHEKDRAWANGKPRKEDIEYWTLNGKGITYAYAAPVAQQHVPEADCGNIDWKAQYEHQKRRAERWIAKYEADIGPLEKAGPVAQQPQEIEVQCPVCNHKFYEWPNDKQPQAEAVPVVDRVYEAAKRLVDHADFQLGGVLSAKSKARDIPSNAASKVKARHLASLRDALAKTPQQAEAVPRTHVLVPKRMTRAMERVTEEEGWAWADLLAAAESITEAEYGEIQMDDATPQQAEAVPSDVVRDAERYRKLRTFHWSESSMCVVLDPKKSVLLGAVCPSGTNLDDYIDAAIAQQKGQP